MISRTYSDGDLAAIARVVTALADQSFATAPWVQYLAARGLVVEDGTGEDADDVVFFAAPDLGLDGNGRVTDGRLSSVALFLAESQPPDRDAIRQVNDRLSGLLTAQWGLPALDPSDDAPRSDWQVGDLTVSLDCFWANGEIGLIMIAIGPTERADVGP